jgi:hypothetical protein
MNPTDLKTENTDELRRRRLFLAFLIGAHLAVTLPLAYLLNAWVDEASTLHSTADGFLHTLRTVFHTEKQAPLYFLLVSIWRDIDPSIFFARLFSIIWSCLAIVFFFRVVLRFFDLQKAFLLTAFFALHPYLIWASLEIRLYSLVVFQTTVLFWTFARGYLDDSKSARVFFVISGILGIYTSYYIGFLLVGGFAALLLTKRFSSAKRYFFDMIVAGVFILPLLWAIKMQLELNTEGHIQVTALSDGIRTLWGHFLTFAVPTEILPTGEQTLVSFIRLWLVRFALLVVFLLILRKKLEWLDEKTRIFGAFTMCTLGFLVVAFLILGGEYISLRHASVIFVPFVLFVAAVLSGVMPRVFWVSAAVFFALLFPYAIHQLYPSLAKRGDWSNVSRFIEQNEKPGQPIITSAAYDAITMPFHYNGVNRVFPDERQFEWNVEAPLNTADAYRRQFDFIISKIPAESSELWVLSRDACHHPETAIACEPLEKFLEENYTVVIEKDFYLERVRLLRKK